MPTYSFSQVKQYETCPLKYRYRYLDKLKREQPEVSPHLALGSAVHTALERLYTRIDRYQEISLNTTLERFSYALDDERQKVDEETDRTSYEKRGVAYLRAYRDEHAPFDEGKVIDIEMYIVFTLGENNQQIKFRGVIDRLDKDGDTLIINDYKTSTRLPSDRATSHHDQVTLYAIAAKEKYGQFADKLVGKIHYLHFTTHDTWEIGDQEMEKVRKQYTAKIKQMEAARFQYNMGDKTAFPAQENPTCKYCEYRDICPLWSHLTMDDEEVDELAPSTVKQLVDEYGELHDQVKKLKHQQDNIKDLLTNYAQQHELTRLFGDEYTLTASSRAYYSIADHDRLAASLAEQGQLEDYLKVDRHQLARALRSGRLQLKDLQGSVEEHISTRLHVGKNKEESGI